MRYSNDWAAWITAGMLLVTPMAATGSQIEGAGPSDRVEVGPTELEAEARALFATPARYTEAVRLFIKAADLREIGDQQRVKNFAMASRLTYYRGDINGALSLMQRAANEALSTGDVLAAAHGFMDSAYLAQEAGEAGVAGEMIKKAERLTYSPLLAQKDKEELRNRISAGA